MAEGDATVYNAFKEDLLLGVHNLASDTIKITLHTSYTPNIDSHQVWSDVSATEYSTASGYTAGGTALSGGTVTQDNTDDEAVFDATDVTWSSLGPLSPATPGHAILWNDTPTSPADPLICYWELGTTATNGGNYTLAFAAEGIINLG